MNPTEERMADIIESVGTDWEGDMRDGRHTEPLADVTARALTAAGYGKVATPTPPRCDRWVDAVSLAVLFIAIVAVGLVLVGVASSGTSPLFVIPPTLVGAWAIGTCEFRTTTTQVDYEAELETRRKWFN